MEGFNTQSLAALVLIPFIAAGACRQEAQQPVHTGAGGGMELWLCVGRGEGPGVNADATLAFDETARLGVAVRRGGVLYTDFDALIIDGRRFDGDALRPMNDLPGWERILWYKVESGRKSYMNTKKNPGWWADIEYVESLENSGRQTLRDVDVSPLKRKGVTWKGRAVGTMRYRVVVEFPGFLLSTPGAPSPAKGGTCPGVRRVSRQGGTGISAVDHAMSLANLPYIWGSAFLAGEGGGGKHQAELFVGADCADLVIAAWHMSGASAIPYRAVVPLLNAYGGTPFADPVSHEKKGFYFSAPGKAVAVGPGGVRPGAAVLWRFGPGGAKGHAAMLVADDGPDGKPNGVLDGSDWVLHTRWDTPALARIKDALPGIAPVAVLGPVPAVPEGGAAGEDRSVEVDLTDQRLRAFEGKRIVLDVKVSTGPGSMTPTGVFRIWKKHVAKDMKVELKLLEKVYYVPNVPYVMYYFNEEVPRTRGFAIHGAYWHKDYGNPVSHGCVNMAIEDAKKLFYWTSPDLRGADHAVESEGNPGTKLVVYGDAPRP